MILAVIFTFLLTTGGRNPWLGFIEPLRSAEPQLETTACRDFSTVVLTV